MHRPWILLLTTLSVAACHAPLRSGASGPAPDRTGIVTYSALLSAPDAQYQLTPQEHAFGAQPVFREPPTYPTAMVTKQLPETLIRVKAIVDGQGRVTEVRDLDPSSDPAHQAFVAACRDAVMRWRYTPLIMVDERDDGHGNITQMRRPVPFSLDYGFRFALVQGRPSVSTEPSPGA